MKDINELKEILGIPLENIEKIKRWFFLNNFDITQEKDLKIALLNRWIFKPLNNNVLTDGGIKAVKTQKDKVISHVEILKGVKI